MTIQSFPTKSLFWEAQLEMRSEDKNGRMNWVSVNVWVSRNWSQFFWSRWMNVVFEWLVFMFLQCHTPKLSFDFILSFFSSGKVMLWNKAILMQKCKITVWFFPPERRFQAHVISLAKLKLGLFGDERIVNCVSRFKNDRCSNDATTNIRVINVNVLKPFLNLIFSHM